MITNNDIMKKLRIALHLRDTDIIEILRLADFETSASELSALFRKEGDPRYRPCGDQILRRFLDGLIIRNRGKREAPSAPLAGPPTSSSAVRAPSPGPSSLRGPAHRPMEKFSRKANAL